MRLTTAFNRILQLPGASVQTPAFTDQGLVIGLRRRRRRLLCPSGIATAARYDSSRRRWRHLDFGACQVWLEADFHRIDWRACGRVRTEQEFFTALGPQRAVFYPIFPPNTHARQVVDWLLDHRTF